MTTEEMKIIIEKLQKDDYRSFVKSMIAIELGIDDEEKLDLIYNKYMKDDRWYLLDDKFYSEP